MKARYISINPNYIEAYNNRGILKSQIGDHLGALADYNKAIVLEPFFLKALNNRAHCYRKLAEVEQDLAKKTDLIAKAETDEQKATSLKKENKS